MVAGTRSTRELGLGAAWLVGTAAAVRFIDVVISSNALTAALLGALLVDVAGARAGVSWGTPEGRSAAPVLARRIGAGALVGVACVAPVVALGGALGWCEVALGVPALPFVFGILRAAAIAVREEVLLRGIVFAAADEAGVPGAWATGFSALASGAAIALSPGASAGAVALAVASGFLFAQTWRRAGGAWTALAAHATWSMFLSTGLRGSLLETLWGSGSFAEGAKAAGAPAWLGAAACALVALGITYRGRSSAAGVTAPRA